MTKVISNGQIDAVRLKRLVDGWTKTREEVKELTDDLGEQVRGAIENHFLHPRAFRAVMAEYRMEPERLAAFYAAQDFYRDALGLRARAESAPTFDAVDDGKKLKVAAG